MKNRFCEKSYDETCLAEGYVEPADFNLTGTNLNELIVGTTGSGKTVSIVYPRLLHSYNSSLVVPITKKKVKQQFADLFRKRGYEILDMDMSRPENSEVGYDPMDNINSDEDVIQLARNIMSCDAETSSESEPYWRESAINVLAALIALERINALDAQRQSRFENVLILKKSIVFDTKHQTFSSNLDFIFEEAERKYPGNQATYLWNTIKGLALVTASAILSFVNTTTDKFSSEVAIDFMNNPKKISFKELGERKTICFITTSPMNKSFQCLINLMYADMFRVLFEAAEQNESLQLDVPVHVLCDDFACGSKIKDFEEYISVFRATGISVTLLLQSESQLISMYGQYAATTIINNCDTYVYMGGNDYTTCQNISQKTNKPIHKIVSMPLEQVIVIRRGKDLFVGRRYQTLEDPLYQQLYENSAFQIRI